MTIIIAGRIRNVSGKSSLIGAFCARSSACLAAPLPHVDREIAKGLPDRDAHRLALDDRLDERAHGHAPVRPLEHVFSASVIVSPIDCSPSVRRNSEPSGSRTRRLADLQRTAEPDAGLDRRDEQVDELGHLVVDLRRALPCLPLDERLREDDPDPACDQDAQDPDDPDPAAEKEEEEHRRAEARPPQGAIPEATDLRAVRQLHLERKRPAVAAHTQRDHAPGRRLSNHSAQLRAALHTRAIHRKDDVMFLEPGFARGSVLIDHGHFHAALILEFQGRQALGSDVGDIDAHVRAGAFLVAGKAGVGGHAERYVPPSRSSAGHSEEYAGTVRTSRTSRDSRMDGRMGNLQQS